MKRKTSKFRARLPRLPWVVGKPSTPLGVDVLKKKPGNGNRTAARLGRAIGAGVAGLAAAGAGVLLAANREIRQFELKEVTVPLLEPGTLPSHWDSLRILHVSDLHMLANQRLKQSWVAGLIELGPDLVVNTGDNLSLIHISEPTRLL